MQASGDNECVYLVDARDRIRSVGPGWVGFAKANSAPELTPEAVVGRSLWDFVAGLEVRHLYRILLEKVRSLRRRVAVPFRCDAPDLRRFVELVMLPSDGRDVEFRVRILRQEPRAFVRLLDASAPRSDELLRICSWCKRVLLPGEEPMEVEDAVARLDLFDRRELPGLTHTICPACERQLEERSE
ncbi:MAG TPA: hypothetical protein VMW35_09270 [Myxococcota bacterium]|nr:hypothetical protein [Myxococcota bacterium]